MTLTEATKEFKKAYHVGQTIENEGETMTLNGSEIFSIYYGYFYVKNRTGVVCAGSLHFGEFKPKAEVIHEDDKFIVGDERPTKNAMVEPLYIGDNDPKEHAVFMVLWKHRKTGVNVQSGLFNNLDDATRFESGLEKFSKDGDTDNNFKKGIYELKIKI